MPSTHDACASVTEIHPEHLLDKLGVGQLSPAERRQLRTHLAACDTCRFELLVRGDLAFESLKLAQAREAGSLFPFAADG